MRPAVQGASQRLVGATITAAHGLMTSLSSLTTTPSPGSAASSSATSSQPANRTATAAPSASNAGGDTEFVQSAPASSAAQTFSKKQEAPQAAPDAKPATVLDTSQTTVASGWNADWRAASSTAPCGSCTGRACTVCSIRTGGPSTVGGLPSGYDQRVVQYYDTTYDGAPANSPETSAPASRSASPDASAGTVSLLAAESANAIVLENQKQGTPESEWLIDAGDPTIEGFSVQFTINHGETVDFKINTDSTNYVIDIYRLGYYGGDGARKITTINKTLATAQVQPDPLFDATRKLVDAGNWNISASWDIPADAVSGIYLAKMTRLDGSQGANIIPFIVRDDEAPSDITFQASDTTWQAYNWWGGYNLYGGVDEGGHAGRASAVSYNRPIITRDGGFSSGPQDFIFSVEYPTIRWLERNGYDVNYISGIDTDSTPGQLLNSKVFLSVGHDEYWSAGQRANVEAARDAGVNLAFLSGNEVYWETRWETSIDGSGTPYKTLVSYKERWDNADTDPGNTTSTWRDPELGSGQPENGLTGTIFTVDSYRLDTIEIPYNLSNFRFWNNTAVADIQPGQVYSLTPNLLGYEWDSDLDNGARPDGLIALSSTTVDVDTLLLDYGNTTGPGTASHSLTLYRAPSGALVFGAGTVYWSWGLDANHDLEVTPTDPNVQQAMVNLFADMGVQPTTLMASLAVASQSTDTTAPVSTITSPTASGTFTAGKPIVVTGTAADSGGGSVAVVEVSTDGGLSWHRAAGFDNWSYSWTPLAGGDYNIKTRSVDDSVNLETPGAGLTISVDPVTLTSIFSPSETPEILSDTDVGFVNLGMKFSSSESGTIVGMKYYKGLGDGGTHVGTLWSSTGTMLASATFTGETASGWQTVTFSNPVQVAAGVTYMASYNSSGHYANTAGYFTTPKTNGPLTAQTDNGYYTYATGTTLPATSSNGFNYWVDVVFSPTNTVNEPPVGVNDDGFLIARNTSITISAATLLANDTDPNGDILTITGVGSTSNGTVTLDTQNNTITFTPTADYTGPARFGYAISDGRGGIGSAFVDMTVTEQTFSLFSQADVPTSLNDSDAVQVNLGVRFTSSTAGAITGIKYYKGANDNGTHTGTLWSSTGTLLATATFTGETASGWQTVAFSNPVAITAGTTYVASFHSNGHYTSTANYFTNPKTTGPLTAPSGNNGVYAYGNGNQFPTNSFGNTNYWVDVIFDPGGVTNTAPVANNDSGYTAQQNTALQIAAASLLANDTDANGDPLTVTGVSAPTNGTATFDAQTNTVTFTPTAGYTGAAGFTYAISDGRGGTSSATVALDVTQTPNTAPVANNDSGYTTQQNTALQITAASLLANDTDADSDPLTVTGVSAPTNGTATFDAQTNTVTFTPTAGYSGAAGFTYAVSDGRGGTASATATLNVSPPATAQSFFPENSTPAVLSENDPNSVELGMRFSASSDGSISGVKFYKGTQNVGTHTGSLWTSTGTLLATMTFTNETASGWQTVAFSNPVSISAGVTYVASYHTDGFYSANNNYFTSSTTNGELTTPANAGVYAYGTASAFPSNTYNASNYWVDVLYTPGAAPSNLAPVANNDSGYTTQQNTALQITAASLLANDTDADGDPLTVTGVSAPTNGAATFDVQTNTITFTPTAGYFGAAGFTYAIADGRGGTASATVALDVTQSPNTAPVANNDSGYTAQQNTALQIAAASLLANDTDANGDPLTVTGVSAPTNGTATFDAQTNTVTFTPTAGYTGAAGFTYAISDGRGGTSSATVALDVTQTPNTAPVANNDSGYTTQQNTALQITAASLLANDTDADSDPLTVTGVSAPTNGAATFDAQTNTVTFTPTAGYSGAAGFTYAVSDGRGGTASATATLNVTQPSTAQSFFPENSTPAVLADNDPNSVELGMRFSASSDGTISGVKFYKGTQNVGTHTGSLWTSTGTLLATTTFTNETASGWQSTEFNSPVQIAAGATYIVSYHTDGFYSADNDYFTSSQTNGSLTAPTNAGVYAYGTASAFPTNTYNSSNYWVDVMFNGQLAA